MESYGRKKVHADKFWLKKAFANVAGENADTTGTFPTSWLHNL